MKKVLLVTHVGDFIPQFEMNNVTILQKMGYEVHYAANFQLSSYGKGDRLENSGIICHQIPFQRFPFRLSNIQAYRKLKRLMKEEQFSMVHCHTPIGGALARLAGRPFRKKGMKMIYTAHGFHFHRGAPKQNWIIYYPVERFLSRFTDVQIVMNAEDRRCAETFHAKRLVQIPGVGIDTKKLSEQTLEDREAFRASLGISPHTFCLLSVGELDRNKNHILVLKALQQMNCEQICYLICGKGEEKEALLKFIEHSRMQECVKLLGYCREIEKYYEAADLFIFPSKREGLPVALMEAMAKGLPVVATSIRGNQDLVEPGRGGLLIDPTSAADVSAAIEKLQKAENERKEMGQFNRETIKAYDQEQVKRTMKTVYREVLS